MAPLPATSDRLRRGFTLVELLVCLAILALVVGLILSAVQRTRHAAATLDCQNRLKQMALAAHQYHGVAGSLPPGTRTKNDPYLFMNWMSRLLPYLEQQAACDQALADYKRQPVFDRPLDGHVNVSRPMPAFNCPLADRALGHPVYLALREEPFTVGLSWYQGVSGRNSLDKDGLLFADGVVRFADIADGTSTTLLVGERPPSGDDHFGWWYAGAGQDQSRGSLDSFLGVAEYNNSYRLPMCEKGPNHFQEGRLDDLCSALHFWSLHAGGANFAFADGSVRFLSYSAAGILPALATRSGGEAAGLD